LRQTNPASVTVPVFGKLGIASIASLSGFNRTFEAVSAEATLNCPQLSLALAADSQSAKLVNDPGWHSSRLTTGASACGYDAPGNVRCVRSNFETRDPAAAEFEAGDFGAPVGLGGIVAPLKEVE